MSKPEVFVSLDIETDGPAPGLNSMLALGAAAFTTADAVAPVGTFYAKLEPLPNAFQDTSTMDWWTTQPEAWEEVNRDRQTPRLVMHRFTEWVNGLKRDLAAKPVAVAWPAAFDFGFVNYYCHLFTEHGNPLGFACLDIRSYANGLAGLPSYYGLPEKVLRKLAGDVDVSGLRPHVAVDDAIEQGRLFMALRERARQVRNQAAEKA